MFFQEALSQAAQSGHEIERFYSFSRWDATFFVILAVVWVVLQISGKSPKTSAVREVVNTVNTRGGNILLLGGFSVWFFSAALRLFYHAIYLLSTHQLDEKSAVLMMGLQFVTGSAFGASFGSMLKTMDGSERAFDGRSSDPTKVVPPSVTPVVAPAPTPPVPTP